MSSFAMANRITCSRIVKRLSAGSILLSSAGCSGNACCEAESDNA